MKFFVIGAVVVVILGGAWLFYAVNKEDSRLNLTPEEEIYKKNDMSFVKTDVAQTGGSKTPPGFPAGIPVENGSIVDSYRGYFSNVGATQYTVSYTSSKTKTELLKLYNDYMTNNGYTIQPQPTSQNVVQTSGYKGNDALSVVVSTQKGVSLVQISFSDR